MFKTELHCHSDDISACAKINVDDIIEKFTDNGYSTLVLSNHFNLGTMQHVNATSWNDWIDKYIAAYTKLKDRAKGKLNILLGMELRFTENDNDYLVFGVTEELLRNYPNMFDMTPDEFSTIARNNGCLFIQAHPFRNRMTVVHPKFLDGVEVFNGHLGHDSRNDIAEMWADKYGLIKTSGTDFHYKDYPASGGILTNFEITSMEQLIEVLKSGKYQLNKDIQKSGI